MPRKKRSRTRTQTRYAWHRRVPWIAIGAGVIAIVMVVLLARSFGIGEGAGRYTGPGTGVGSHVTDGQPIAYPSYPPTSGQHWPAPDTWGYHSAPVPDERAVHNLEHGGVVASYNNIPAADLTALQGLLTTYPKDKYGQVKLLIRPYDRITPGTIVLTAWNWIDELPGYDEARIRRFMDAHLGQCCEDVR